MTTATVTVTATFTNTDMPGNTPSVQSYRARLLNGAGSPLYITTVDPVTGAATFLNVALGTYTLSVEALDIGGNIIGTPATKPLAVSGPPPVTRKVPTAADGAIVYS
jgi:hypothetical protein